jgi:hypothetical protein
MPVRDDEGRLGPAGDDQVAQVLVLSLDVALAGSEPDPLLEEPPDRLWILGAGAGSGARQRGLQLLQAIPDDVEVFERQASADGHAAQRVVGHVAGHAGHLGEQPVEVAE